jgi:hypothetical protein
MDADVFVGLDWATQEHAVCVIDAAGRVLEHLTVSHDRDGLAELLRRLVRHGRNVRIAIERPSGVVVDVLVEAGHQVFPIHPNAVKASRPRYRSHGAKSDASDAYAAGGPAAHRRPPLDGAGATVRCHPRTARSGTRPR